MIQRDVKSATLSRKVSVLLLTCCLLLAVTLPTFAQSGGAYDLSWWTIGSSGVSSGGSYILNGTIGQPEAGPLMKDNNGRFTLTGGFTDIAANPPIVPPLDEKVYLPIILNN